MKLDIYDKKGNVVKTCEKDVHDILVCTIEDVSRAFDLRTDKEYSSKELSELITKFIQSDMDGAKEIVANTFGDLTVDEVDTAKFEDIILVLIQVVGYTFKLMGRLKSGDEKN